MASERDQLAREIFAADNYYAPDPYDGWEDASSAQREYAYTIADGLIANGWGHVPTALHQAADDMDEAVRRFMDALRGENAGWVSPAEVARRETMAKAEAWQEGYEMGMYDTPPDPTNNPYCSTTEGAGE